MPKKTLSYQRSLTMTVGMMLAVAAMDDLTIRSAEGRLAAVLLRLCGARLPELGGPAQTVIDVTQSELGDRPVSPLWRSSRVTCYAAWAA
jgi:hypothetical protein